LQQCHGNNEADTTTKQRRGYINLRPTHTTQP
jgi:hypothetical protein